MGTFRGALIGLVMFGVACDAESPKEPVLLGGHYVLPETLALGRQIYVRNCMACHGKEGDGKGPSSPAMNPPPRDFTTAQFRFAATSPGNDLPRDEEIMRVLDHGLTGTPMMAVDLTMPEKVAVVQYIKTFSDDWRDPTKKVESAYRPTKDPFIGEADRAKAMGEAVYHGKAACWACHPAYVSKAEINGYEASFGVGPSQVREDAWTSLAMNPYPPDYLWDGVKLSSTREGVYRTLIRGLSGSGMPAYQSILTDEEVWAVAYYVSSLVGLGNADSSLGGREFKRRKEEFDLPPELGDTQEEIPEVEVVAVQEAPTSVSSSALVERGRTLSNQYGCQGCHSLNNNARGLGPSLYDLGARMERSEIKDALLNPDGILAEGYENAKGLMKATLMGNGFYDKVVGEDLEAMLTYLESLEGE